MRALRMYAKMYNARLIVHLFGTEDSEDTSSRLREMIQAADATYASDSTMKACVILNAQLARPQVYKVHPLASPEAAEQDKKIHEIHDRVLTQHAIRHTVAVDFLVFLVASIYNIKPFHCSVLNTGAFRVPRNRFLTKEEVFSQAKIAIGRFRENYDDDEAQKWTTTNGAADDEAAMERPTRGRTPGQKARPTAAQTRARRNQTQKRRRAEERALANMLKRPRGRPRKTS
ncbi:hypothetical protein CEUSTIGMA_g7121.t1 [Chlamydomonas eustigma]|uniref:Uncharacterized protein n=1 Tax=Chlamydomonas eustigma TaxID=1157962 RepID=A0A250XA95_9CHLO|nr:hypothetical protein CEUSTIGMA_g7121.t1 [Chlamydomonas eustigma]|eukprot:GAX79680.1 hypothetical protein CEUSTIGMA_g7121.t1 [Chlamydomonas eustigma]